MSAASPVHGIEERLLTFEIGGSVHALPIACVIEVTAVQPLSCIPTLPPNTAVVMNHHGDALPVLRRSAFFEVEEQSLPAPGHVLVITPRPTGGARLGLPVDRIVGLVEGAGAVARTTDPVAERRSIDGRVVSILDPERLASVAQEVIERSLERSE